jgi:transposase
MPYNNCIEKLIGLKEIILEDVKDVCGEQHIYISMEKRIHSCPACGEKTSKVHDYRVQVVKDLHSFEQITYLHLRKRRHVCPVCGKKFYEEVDFLPRYQRMTSRLFAYVISQFENVQPIKHIAKLANISATTAARIFDNVRYPKPKISEAISIDEFRGNAGGEKYQCILTDPAKKRVLDVLPKRKADSLYEYFSSIENRKLVKYVTMDMSSLFKGVVKTCFPNAIIVADRFHVVRQVCWAMENVRKEEQKKFNGSRRRYFKRSKTLLLKHRNKLKDYEVERIAVMLQTSQRLARAYYALQDFYDFMESTNSREARRYLGYWMMRVQSYDLPEFQAAITAVLNWTPEILASFDCGLSNGYTEGVNNKIKVIKRVSYGVQNFERFRNRIIMAMNA